MGVLRPVRVGELAHLVGGHETHPGDEPLDAPVLGGWRNVEGHGWFVADGRGELAADGHSGRLAVLPAHVRHRRTPRSASRTFLAARARARAAVARRLAPCTVL